MMLKIQTIDPHDIYNPGWTFIKLKSLLMKPYNVNNIS